MVRIHSSSVNHAQATFIHHVMLELLHFPNCSLCNAPSTKTLFTSTTSLPFDAGGTSTITSSWRWTRSCQINLTASKNLSVRCRTGDFQYDPRKATKYTVAPVPAGLDNDNDNDTQRSPTSVNEGLALQA